jgi:hypothetical protein
MLAERLGGTRALARAIAGDGDTDLEPTVRRWLAFAAGELRPVGEVNRVLGRLAKFSRLEIKKMGRRITTQAGPAGDRQAIGGHLAQVYGAGKPAVLAPEEMLAFPFAIVLLALFAFVWQAIGRAFEKADKRFMETHPCADRANFG